VARYLDAHHDGAALVEADEVEVFEVDGRSRIGWLPMGAHRELLEL